MTLGLPLTACILHVLDFPHSAFYQCPITNTRWRLASRGKNKCKHSQISITINDLDEKDVDETQDDKSQKPLGTRESKRSSNTPRCQQEVEWNNIGCVPKFPPSNPCAFLNDIQSIRFLLIFIAANTAIKLPRPYVYFFRGICWNGKLKRKIFHTVARQYHTVVRPTQQVKNKWQFWGVITP